MRARDLPNESCQPKRWVSALNAAPAAGDSRFACRFVASTFHARFSAKGKSIVTEFGTAPVLPPFERIEPGMSANRSTQKHNDGSCADFVGTHDFAAFAANRGTA